MEKPNLKLKAAIISAYGTQVRFARAVIISELRLSQIIHGRVTPTIEEMLTISKQLRVDPDEVFPNPVQSKKNPKGGNQI